MKIETYFNPFILTYKTEFSILSSLSILSNHPYNFILHNYFEYHELVFIKSNFDNLNNSNDVY
jgi:hypothetical protein